jgi:hypothetical protein
MGLARDARHRQQRYCCERPVRAQVARFSAQADYVPSAPFDGPLYRLPALASTFTVIAPVALAIASGAIRELREIVATKVPLGSMKTARDRGAVQSAVAEAEGMIRSARLFFYEALTTAWERAVAREPFTLGTRPISCLPARGRCAARAGRRISCTAWAGRLGSTRGTGWSATSATRRPCGTTASCLTAGWRRSGRFIRGRSGVSVRGVLTRRLASASVLTPWIVA